MTKEPLLSKGSKKRKKKNKSKEKGKSKKSSTKNEQVIEKWEILIFLENRDISF